jgi:hypothetical protein
MKKRYYEAGDGTKYPLIEATIPFAFKVYRTDCKAAVIGDPLNCLIARGGRRHPNVLALYIGTGKDAYVILSDGRGGAPVAVHYTLNAKASRVRDHFDTNKKIKTQVITLSVPTPGRTLEHRSALGKKRREEIKNGAEVKKRGHGNTSRVQRLGVRHRPRAKLVNDIVRLATRDGEAA